MDRAEAESFYHRYLDRLNEQQGRGLEAFVHEQLFYNERPMSRADYEALIADSFAAVPDLRFQPHLLVAGEDHIACRLRFDCTPAAEFLGLRPTGKSVVFAEHVFYRLQAGKISEVWSLLDRAAIEEQFASDGA